MAGVPNIEDGERLEISLVRQAQLAHTGAIFFGLVLGAGTAKGHRFLKLKHEDNSYETVGTKEVIFLKDYFLLSLTWTPSHLAPVDTVRFETEIEQQNEGYEVICHILEQAGIKEEVEEEEPEMKATPTHKGPRRVEVGLVSKSCPQKRAALVVVEYSPPTGVFVYHTIRGRAWAKSGTIERLEGRIEVYNSDMWWIDTITNHASPGKYSASFHGQGDSAAWRRLGELMERLHPAEVEVVKHFKYQPDESTPHATEYHRGGGSHYRNPYTSPAVLFRVAGDEIGKKAYLVQAEKQVQSSALNPPTLEEFLEKAEKKSEAEDVSASHESSSAASEKSASSVGDAADDNAGSSDNNHGPRYTPDLADVVADEGHDLGALPHIPGLGDIPLSAIDRILRKRFPGLAADVLFDPLSGKRRKVTLH
jgi:hypothetical protein